MTLRSLFIAAFLILVTACGGGDNPPPGNANGTIKGTVRNAETDTPLANVLVQVYDSNGSPVQTTNTDANGDYSFSLAAAGGYEIDYTLTGFYSVTYENITVVANTSSLLAPVLQIDETITGTGDISGTIVDAQTGGALAGVTVNFRVGINVRTGTIIDTATTDANGAYTINTLITGIYTCELILNNYVVSYATVYVLGGQIVGNQNSAISQTVNSGVMRIVLEWGATPLDLDSHLTGPDPVNVDRFHVYYSSRNVFDANSDLVVNLDVDDTDSYGPETVTILQQLPGLYRYSVFDFSNRSSNPSSTLATSEAKVTVYRDNALPLQFFVPNQPGTLWTVFTMENGAITPVNSMTYETTSGNIKSVGNNLTDVHLMRNLPAK